MGHSKYYLVIVKVLMMVWWWFVVVMMVVVFGLVVLGVMVVVVVVMVGEVEYSSRLWIEVFPLRLSLSGSQSFFCFIVFYAVTTRQATNQGNKPRQL